MNWKSFVLGTIIGIIMGVFLFSKIGNRYEVKNLPPPYTGLMKTDTWTGKVWFLGPTPEGSLIHSSWTEISSTK